ncbi:hypothetical protein [Paenibacillus tarimensis]|uniref:hypothetical protein n=1 Tax=Paenibacillus tarimensis TaxID=416012 RepID=UPI001F3CCB98|nr:hypothetical protein [Paenibacillus tarimensis]MCF2943696.1 hypothetical protein [Paenibacillus tarimensis]
MIAAFAAFAVITGNRTQWSRQLAGGLFIALAVVGMHAIQETRLALFIGGTAIVILILIVFGQMFDKRIALKLPHQRRCWR